MTVGRPGTCPASARKKRSARTTTESMASASGRVACSRNSKIARNDLARRPVGGPKGAGIRFAHSCVFGDQLAHFLAAVNSPCLRFSFFLSTVLDCRFCLFACASDVWASLAKKTAAKDAVKEPAAKASTKDSSRQPKKANAIQSQPVKPASFNSDIDANENDAVGKAAKKGGSEVEGESLAALLSGYGGSDSDSESE